MTVALELPDRQEWTVDDLAELPPDLPVELINGRLVVPSPTMLHQWCCTQIVIAIAENCPPEFVVSHDQSMRVDWRNEPRPDVVAAPVEYLTQTQVPVDGCPLVVEVLSPTSTFRDLHEKAGVYAKAGIDRCWVVDVLRDPITLTEFVLSNGAYVPGTHTDGEFSTDRPWPISLDLPAVGARIAQMRAAADVGRR